MSRREEQREAATAAIARHLLKAGLSQTSLRQLASAAGVSDRMLLYYFDDKSDVLAAAIARVAEEMATTLNKSLPADVALPPGELLQIGAKLTTSAAMKPFMRISIEIAAAANRGEDPYRKIFSDIVAGFLAWIEMRLATPDPARRSAEAAMLLAMIDGIAVLSAGAKKSVVDNAVAALSASLQQSLR